MVARECLLCDVKWVGSEADPCWMCASTGRTILGVFGRPTDNIVFNGYVGYGDD